MKIIGRYFLLEYKKCWKAVVKSAFGMIFIFLFISIGVLVVSAGIQKEQLLPKLKVAIVVSEDERILNMALRFAESLDSVESICEFYYMDEEKARNGLKIEELQAVIILPVNFYEDIDNGLNTPAEIIVSKQNPVNSAVFSELLKAGISYLQIAEAGVYAALDAARDGTVQIQQSQIGNFLAEYYMRTLFDRMDIYEKKIISPFGEMDNAQYIVLTILLLLLLSTGSIFAVLYEQKEKAVEYKLKSYGVNGVILMLMKIFIIANCLCLLWGLCYAGSCMFSFAREWNILWWNTENLLWAYLLCVSIAAFFHMVYVWSDRAEHGAMLLLFLSIGMVLCSGMIVPSTYLSKEAEIFGAFLPVSFWSRYMQNMLFDTVQTEQIVKLVLYTGIEMVAGAVAVWKNVLFGMCFRSKRIL